MEMTSLTSPWQEVPASGDVIAVTDGKNIRTTAESCRYDTIPLADFRPAEGGDFSFTVHDFNNCGWSVYENIDWLRITGMSSGVGSGLITYNIDEYYGPDDISGKIIISGSNTSLEYTVGQEGRVTKKPVYGLLLSGKDTCNPGSQTVMWKGRE